MTDVYITPPWGVIHPPERVYTLQLAKTAVRVFSTTSQQSVEVVSINRELNAAR